MSKNLLLEGAVAGHMNHIYDNGEMTFGELKQLLQAAVDGKLRGTEKTDGQNVYLSFDVKTQKARAIRNKTQILAGGLTVEEFDEFFSGHANQALRFSFVEALQAFEDVIKTIDRDTQFKIFGTKKDNIYFNTEVMNPGTIGLEEDDPRGKGTTNVIPYDKKTLLIHAVGHDKFHPKTGRSLTKGEGGVDLTSNYQTLESALMGKSSDDPSVFSVETHPERRLEPAGQSRAGKILKPTIKAIDDLVKDFGLNDSATIQDMVMVQLTPLIDQFGLTEDRNQDFILRLMGLCRSLKDPSVLMPCGTKDPTTNQSLHHPPIKMRKLTAGVPPDLAAEIKEFDDSFKYQKYTSALSDSLYDFTNAILQDFHSSFIADNKGTIKKLQDEIKASIKKIKNSSNDAAKQDLEKQLKKLKDIKNINTPSEGFVFDFNGATYKFTGWFAPSNQILGTERYNRFGPIDAIGDELDGAEGATEALRIAIFPGSFKPPHLGHLQALNALAAEADVAYVFVSDPQLSGRALKTGAKITAEQAIACWDVFLQSSPVRNKIKVMVGPKGVASPVKTTIDFIQNPADPNNVYIAPPNATVLLGVGKKGGDESRYEDKMIATAKEKRPDLKIKAFPVGPFEHSKEYMKLLSENPAIGQMLNKGKGRLSPEELSDEERLEGKVADKHLFHASDMRDFIDMSMEDPIALRFLEDFVPRKQDVLSILNILGVSPANIEDIEPEEDQVKEPEIDREDLQEMIRDTLKKILQEDFKSQTAPRARPDSGKFQTSMRKRLSKAHKTYLDMGRHDLTKHGGGFHLDRPKDISNAFLAEEEVEEASSMAGGNIAGAPGIRPVHKREDEELKEQEAKLRKTMKIAIKEFFNKKKQDASDLIEYVIQEHELRLALRKLIVEAASEDPTVDVHDNTGINTLKDLMKNSNVLSTLRNVYKTLTTHEEQKLSFRAHIIRWVQDTLAPVKLNDRAIDEQRGVDIDIQGVGIDSTPGDEDKFIDAEDGSEKEMSPDPAEEDEKMKPISGADTTGRNKAERVYPTIEKSIVDYYGELDNPEDQEMFYDYLIANLKLYFDKWDNEMSKTPPEEPTNSEYEQAKVGAPEEAV